MVTKTEIPKGYKQTEVGVVPEDWGVKKLGDVLKVKHGKSQKEVEDKSGQYPILGTGGLMSYTNHFLYDKPSVLIGRKGTIDKPQFMNTPFWTVDTLFYTEIYKDNFPKYLYYKFLQIDWYSYNEASGVPSLNAKTIEKIELAFPPNIEEQAAIAEVLSDADALIESLEKLIAKKRNIKQGTMQELLTGKKRLPGFSGKWEVKRLGDVCELKNGYAFKSSTYNETGEYKIITIANVQDGYMDSTETNNIINLPLDIQEHQKLEIGDILISMTGNVGRVCFVDNKNSLLNQRVGKLVASKIDRMFFFYVCNSRLFINSMIVKAQGGAQGNIGKNDILEYEVEIPTQIEEQTAIAQILSDMDAEIEALEQKRDKYKAVKQGMMQELLTGKTRLI